MSTRRPSASLPIAAVAILAGSLFSLYRQQNFNNTSAPASTARHRRTAGSTRDAASVAPPANSSSEGNLLLGNPSNAGKDPNNFLLERPQYSLSYNKSRGGPNWVSWHTDASDFGDSGRGQFRPDPDLPADWQITPDDYKDSGYDRGHMCPSGDRTSSRDYNRGTFFMSNMVPQTGDLNRDIWAHLEEYLRYQIKLGGEVYEITGPRGESGRIADGKVAVPATCWKIAVLLPLGDNDKARVAKDAEVLAVEMPNVENPAYHKEDWHDYLTTAGALEKSTGLKFFTNLPDSVRSKLEGMKYTRQ